MKRIEELDSFKAIACLLVIIIHVTATPVTVLGEGTADEWYIGGIVVWVITIFNRFAKPSVPMFIFASGLALYYRYGESAGAEKRSENDMCGSADFCYFEFLGRRAGKILIPYALWCTVYYAWFIYFGIYEFDIMFFVRSLISGKMIYHLYFVVAIVQYYLLFGVFRRLTAKCGVQSVIPAAFALNLAEVCLIPDLYYGRCFVTYITVFLIGTYTAKHIDTVRGTIRCVKSLASLAAGTLVTGAVYTMQFTRDMAWEHGIFEDDKIFFTVFSIFASLLIYGLCVLNAEKTGSGCGISGKIGFLLVKIGESSFYIFLSHPLFMLIAELICRVVGITGVLKEAALSFVLIFVFCIPLSIGYANFKSRRHRNIREKIS
ncbi:MAG: acyltransferase [Firmicutes bacterium]|nr:acyltransferase [Bacillota bacterium]